MIKLNFSLFLPCLFKVFCRKRIRNRNKTLSKIFVTFSESIFVVFILSFLIISWSFYNTENYRGKSSFSATCISIFDLPNSLSTLMCIYLFAEKHTFPLSSEDIDFFVVMVIFKSYFISLLGFPIEVFKIF